MTAVALLSAAAGVVTALWWVIAYRMIVGSPGTVFRRERHHLMATGGFALAICGSLGLMLLDVISQEWAATIACTAVAVTMLWRTRLLYRAQEQQRGGKHREHAEQDG